MKQVFNYEGFTAQGNPNGLNQRPGGNQALTNLSYAFGGIGQQSNQSPNRNSNGLSSGYSAAPLNPQKVLPLLPRGKSAQNLSHDAIMQAAISDAAGKQTNAYNKIGMGNLINYESDSAAAIKNAQGPLGAVGYLGGVSASLNSVADRSTNQSLLESLSKPSKL